MSKNRVLYLFLLFVVGFVGYYIAKYDIQQTNKKQSTSQANKEVIVKNIAKPDNINTKKQLLNKTVEYRPKKLIKNITTEQYLTTNLLPANKISLIIDKLQPYELDNYFNKFFANKDDFNTIIDKKQFAKNLTNEFLDENSKYNIQTDGYSQVHFSLTDSFTTKPITDFVITDNTSSNTFSIYAHLELNTNLNNNAQIFIKWMNLTTGKVLLFTKKDINSITNKNWVSWTPNTSWKVGEYQVKFYSFETQLKLIAYGIYNIYKSQ